jgi:hypothetical protein
MASAALRATLLASLRLLLKPVVHLLLRWGVGYKEFAEVAKLAYVEVASREFGIRGRPTNVSRVALLTGFTRREVRRLRASLDQQPTPPSTYLSAGSRVLSGWHQDPDFTRPDGAPLLLERGSEGPSFEMLARRYASDVPATALLKELKNVGAVVQLEDGRLQVVSRSFVPPRIDATLLRMWGSTLHDLGATFGFNLLRSPEQPPRFQRRAVGLRVSARMQPKFREWLATEGQAFLERADTWLTANEARTEEEPALRLGVGLFEIEDREEDRP